MINNIIETPKGPFSLKKLALLNNDRVVGKAKIIIKSVSAIDNAKRDSITFIDNNKYLEKIFSTKASACIISEEVFNKYNFKLKLAFLVSKNPYLSYAKILNIFFPQNNSLKDNN